MAPSFPLSRAALPTVAESARERAAARRAMLCLLEHTVAQFDAQMVARHGEADATVWKPISSPAENPVRVFRERSRGESGRVLARKLNAVLTQGELSEREAHRLRSSYLAALTAPAVMGTSCADGKVESAMFALLAPTNEDTALLASFMLDDIADCAVLRAICQEQQGRSAASRFLGYKYIVRSAGTVGVAATGRRFHDQCYLEFCGYTESPASGERLGFHLVHSVDLREFPDLSAFHSSRAPALSARYLFRQRSDKTVEVFMQGNALEVAAVMALVWNLKRLLACAEAKRLTQMVRRSRDSVEFFDQSTRRPVECYLCHRSKRFFGGAALSECYVCRQLVCTKCRNDKRVFVTDAPPPRGSCNDASEGLGRFERVKSCKTCVLVASAGCAPPPMHILISEHMQDVTRGRSESSSGSSRSSVSATDRGLQLQLRSIASTTSTWKGNSRRGPRRQRPTSAKALESAPSAAAPTNATSTSLERELAASSDRVLPDRVPSHRPSPAVHVGHSVPLQASVSVAKTRARPQQLLRRSNAPHDNAVDAAKPVVLNQQHTPPRHKPVGRSNGQSSSHQETSLSRCDTHSLQRSPSATGSSNSPSGSFSSDSSRPSGASLGSEPPSSLYARIIEISKVVESTYNTTQQNGAYMAQQVRRENHRVL